MNDAIRDDTHLIDNNPEQTNAIPLRINRSKPTRTPTNMQLTTSTSYAWHWFNSS
jgi:hypothetical protein